MKHKMFATNYLIACVSQSRQDISTEYTKQNLHLTKKTQSNPSYFEGDYDGPTTTSAA